MPIRPMPIQVRARRPTVCAMTVPKSPKQPMLQTSSRPCARAVSRSRKHTVGWSFDQPSSPKRKTNHPAGAETAKFAFSTSLCA